MGNLSTATYKETLKQYAYGVAQDVKSALADFIAPRVPVGVGTGMFKKFDDKNAFQRYDTARAVGGPATRIEFASTDGNFNCEANALEVPIDDQEREKAGDAQSALEEAKTRTLVINASLAREKRVFDLVKANVAAAASKGAWSSDATANPIDEIDEQIEAIATLTGLMPNRMVIGLGAWRVLKNHANVIARLNGSPDKSVSLDAFAGMLLNPQIDIRVGIMSIDANKMGKAASKSNVVGSEIFLFHGSDNPTQYDPGFAKTFSVGANSVEAVRLYREERNRSDILAVDWSEDVQVVSAICAKRITVS